MKAPIDRIRRVAGKIRFGATLLLSIALASIAASSHEDVLPEPQSTVEAQSPKVGLDPHVGAQLPLAADFRDDRGAKVVLGDYFGSTPVIVTPVYYGCPNLCLVTLDSLADRLRTVDLRAGRDFRVVAVSIDPHEGPMEASTARVRVLSRYARCVGSRSEECRDGWRFLTGQHSSIDALTSLVGFHYKPDPKSGQYIHPIAIVIATPQGRIARYFTDVDTSTEEMRAALLQAGAGQVDSVVDRFWMLCDRYRDAMGSSSSAFNAVRLVAIVGFLALLVVVIRLVRRTS